MYLAFYYMVYIALQLTWGIIQNFCALSLSTYLFAVGGIRKIYAYRGSVVLEWNYQSSMALGMFIFFGHSEQKDSRKFLNHEYGHTLQSAVLGPLYLPVIGIPSFMWANRIKNIEYRCIHSYSYFEYYTEKWANKWADIITKESTPD